MEGIVSGAPKLAIVVVNHNTADLTCECLDAVHRFVPMDTAEVIVVDNGSSDGSARRLGQRFPRATLVCLQSNVGFGEGSNRGVEAASATYVILLNSDAILHMNTPAALAEYLESHPEVACVGPRIELPDGSPQPRVFGGLPSPWRVAMQSWGLSRLLPGWRLFDGIDGLRTEGRVTEVGWISGVCMAMRRSDYQAVGGFDPAFFMYCEDIDLCARLGRRFGRIMHVDDWAVTHLGGASSRPEAARLRNAVWQQRNLLRIVAREYSPAAQWLAGAAMVPGHLLRLAAGGLALLRSGGKDRLLLRSAWLRLLDLFGLLRRLPG